MCVENSGQDGSSWGISIECIWEFHVGQMVILVGKMIILEGQMVILEEQMVGKMDIQEG